MSKKSSRAAKAQSFPSREAMAIARRVNALPTAAQKELALAAKAQSPVQPAADERLTRIMAFQKSPAGAALAEAESALENGIALASILLQTLEASPGSEHEAMVLRIAIEHLESAALHLDNGGSGAARSSQEGRRSAAA
jgi:hypothetical protein